MSLTNEEIDRYSDAFTEFMTPDETGIPIAPIESLRDLLQTLGFPTDMEPVVAKQVDPGNTGFFEFTAFVNTCEDLFRTPQPIQRKRPRSEAYGPDEVDDDSDDPSYGEESEELATEPGTIPAEADDSSASESRPKVNRGTKSGTTNRSGGNFSADEAFAVLSQGGDRITPESLARVSQIINVQASPSDLQRMVELVSSREEFYKLWK